VASEKVSEELTVCFDPDGFRAEVTRELEEEEGMLAKVQNPRSEVTWGHAVTILLLAISVSAIYFDSALLYMWLVVGFLLYSYNFVILLLPTTTDHARPKEISVLKTKGKDENWLAIKLLAKKRKLAVEIGLTVFLGGMVPLVWSFTVIFGVGLFFAVYFAAFAHLIDWNVASSVILQVALILGFYGLMYILEPETQGITRIARTIKGRYGEARTQGRMAVITFMMIMISIVLISSILVIGALLLPGSTMATILGKVITLGQASPLYWLPVLAIQIFIMRHFQVVASQNMAIRLLKARTERMRVDVLQPLEALMAKKGLSEEQFEAEFVSIRRIFYSQAIYDIIKADFFGRSPVYLVGPRLKYVLDDKVLNHFHS
jgi:hypothetical protein